MGDPGISTGIKYDWNVENLDRQLHRLRRPSVQGQAFEPHHLTCLFIGLAAKIVDDSHLEIGFVVHDGTYSIDFLVRTIDKPESEEESRSLEDGNLASKLEEQIVIELSNFEQKHDYKFLGAGLNKFLAETCPNLPSLLWSELDIVPFVFERDSFVAEDALSDRTIDEVADFMARLCVGYYGPAAQPRIMVGHRGEVLVDANAHAPISGSRQYEKSVGQTTWAAVSYFAKSVRERNVKIAFFSATPQGGGVALMRHALVRFLRTMGINCKWYVPRPRPEVFRITKTNHNILQGVADPEERLTGEQQQILDEWAEINIDRKWNASGRPLAARKDGGADLIIVDDPQMPSLVSAAKKIDPTRPVIFRSHIQVRGDLADSKDTPTAEVWKWIWNHIREADIFVSHPVQSFVPHNVDPKKVAWLPATTDWLDGLNKHMSSYNCQHYIHEFNTAAFQQEMQRLDYPERDYIVQIARFDPSKGIPDVLASYALLRRKYLRDRARNQTPQLVIAGHGSVDDPDGSRIFDHTLQLLETKYEDIAEDVVLQRVGPTDQILNALMSKAKVALQLSTREGFEVKVSEALHKGVPIIATKAGGIPLQVQHGKSGYLVDVGDHDAVAKHIFNLITNQGLYKEMSEYAAHHTSDEVSTVGNALAWLYLADTLTKGEGVQPAGRWLNDLAREKAGVPYQKGETYLPRGLSTPLVAGVV